MNYLQAIEESQSSHEKMEAEIEALKEAFADLSKRVYWLEVKGKSCR